MTIGISIVSIIIITICVGCKKEKNDEQIIPDNGVFDETDYSDITDDMLFFNDISRYYESRGLVKIIQIDLWRRHFDCRKLGICDIIILGDTIYQSRDYDEPSREIVVAIEPEQKNAIMTLMLANPIPEVITPQDLFLYVDEDIYGYEEKTDSYVVFPQGTYEYDPNIGNYGGYNVYYSTGRVNN